MKGLLSGLNFVSFLSFPPSHLSHFIERQNLRVRSIDFRFLFFIFFIPRYVAFGVGNKAVPGLASGHLLPSDADLLLSTDDIVEVEVPKQSTSSSQTVVAPQQTSITYMASKSSSALHGIMEQGPFHFFFFFASI